MLTDFTDGTPLGRLVPQVERAILGRVGARFLANLAERLCINSPDVLVSILFASTGILCVAFDHAVGAPEVGTF